MLHARYIVLAALLPALIIAAERLLGGLVRADEQTHVHAGAAGQPAHPAELGNQYVLVTDKGYNLLLFVGGDESLIVGPPRPALVAQARDVVARRSAAPIRYAVLTEDNDAPRFGDGAWQSQGVAAIVHENTRFRMAAAQRRGEWNEAAHLALPTLGFSHVMQLFLKDEEVHIVRERPGASDADTIVHFEKSGMLFLGATFTRDGYPRVMSQRGGSLDGIVETVSTLLRDFGADPAAIEPIVPGRGQPATFAELRAYLEMLVTIRTKVAEGVGLGLSIDEVVGSAPTAAYDAQWGRGEVSPDEFTRSVYRQVVAAKAAARPRARR